MNLGISLKRKTENIDIKNIVKMYHEMVYRTCYSLVMNIEDAEDITQEVFISAFKKQDSFREESKISTWLYRIAVNLSLNFIRDKKVIISIKENVEAPTTNIDESEQNTIKKQILKKALEKLPEKQRAMFVMNKYNGLTAKEISEVLECSQNKVEVSIHRATKTLINIVPELYKKEKDRYE